MNSAILGAGYLGKEVALFWSKRNYHVTATTRHLERISDLAPAAQKCVILKEANEETLAPLLFENDTLLVTIAAASPDNYESAYLQTALALRHLAIKSKVIRRLIYTSSTSVYGDHQGFWVDEASELKAKSDQVKILIETEKVYSSLQELGWPVCIFRLAEIYGPGRELSLRLRSNKNSPLPGTGDNYSNMIHRDDIVAAIDYALKHHLTGIYNLSDDDHPTRQQLYQEITHRLSLPPVKWDPAYESFHGGNKRVSNHKIKSEGFVFLHPHRMIE